MRTFREIAEELGLIEFLPSRCGTLYAVPIVKGSPLVMVRHFDNELPPAAVVPYVDLIRACKRWIGQYPELVRLVRIEEPFEVGRDFYARTFHSYYTSLNSYTDTDPEEGVDPPPELTEMRLYLRGALASRPDQQEGVVEKILRRSLLEPSSKTVFSEDIEQFIVVEPRIEPEDVRTWAKQS
ncbi:hypothetical protein [Candidatus Thiosymbion oneisti]|uniref:hypothetical protein n=1 Tax=Candidatus Thiosymbion oneisti TaxID=589554 RepID=UPI00105DE0C8|nr:hypothetical protein [Candidatus Thiosymbion oneisti]